MPAYQLPGTADLHVEGRDAIISILEWILKYGVMYIANNKIEFANLFRKKMHTMQIIIENNGSRICTETLMLIAINLNYGSRINSRDIDSVSSICYNYFPRE